MLDKVNVTEVQTSEYVGYTEMGLNFAEDTPYSVWEAVFTQLVSAEKSIRWWIGDALRFAEAHYGEKYTQALEGTPYTYGTLRNSVYVASKYSDMSCRHDDLPFGHHEAAASLEPDEREEVLLRASHGGWTQKQVREEVQERKALPATLGGDTKAETILMKDCPLCGVGKVPVESMEA